MSANNRTQSAYTVIRDVLRVIGLPVPVSIAGAVDSMSVQIWQLLTELGQELLDLHEWSFKTKTYSFATTGATLYDVPTDFVRFIPDTGWNNTTQLPIYGPLSPQAWGYLTARNLGSTIELQWRYRNDKIEFFSVPSTPVNIDIQYISRGWVLDVDGVTYKDTAENDADTVLYDPRLIKAMLRWRWRRAKGFNTTDLEVEFRDAFSAATNKDSPGKTLYLAGVPSYPFIGERNIPDTGIGS